MTTLAPLPTVVTCTIEGCTNRRSNAGYGRFRPVCEKHHHERYRMDYEKGSKAAKSKTQLIREDLQELSTVAQEQGVQDVIDRIEELLTKKYVV